MKIGMVMAVLPITRNITTDSVAITSHRRRPSGDAVCAALALRSICGHKRYLSFCAAPLARAADLGGYHNVHPTAPRKRNHGLTPARFLRRKTTTEIEH